ncbi:ethanolamine ammonia-lyase light chain EutC [Methylobacterium oryzae]|uniref:ethanolamine ammonia-lyase light chain EutC n=1 Tax=Methylobacterium oryzae TaxID=334852 RepID=UPI002F35D1C0
MALTSRRKAARDGADGAQTPRRPGRSASDSLGCYVTFGPEPGLPDSRRNCISNIRQDGLSVEAAAGQMEALLRAMLAQGTSGVALRRAERVDPPAPALPDAQD